MTMPAPDPLSTTHWLAAASPWWLALAGLGFAALLAWRVAGPAIWRGVWRGAWRGVWRVGQRRLALLGRLGRAAEHLAHPIAVIDTKQRLGWRNQAFRDLLAPAAGERSDAPQPLAQVFAELGLAEADRPRLLQALQHGLPLRLMLRQEAGDSGDAGSVRRCLSAELQPVVGEDGRARGHLLVMTDCTEQLTQQLRLEALLAALPNGVVVRNAEGRVIECNPAAERQLMLRRPQIQGDEPLPAGWHTVYEDLRPMPPEARPATLALRQGTGLRDLTMGVVAEGGTVHWLLVNTEPVRDREGRTVGAVSCYADITEQRDQQMVLAHTVATAGLGSWQWDIRTDAVSFNDRLVTMLGYRIDEVEHSVRAWYSLMHPDDRQAWRELLRRHLTDPDMPCRLEMRLRRPDGEWAAVLCCGMVIARDADGRPCRMAGINIDLTEQHQMQAMLRHAARTDGLTQLPNRAAVFDHVQQLIDRAARQPGFGYAVLFMDFDRFKQVNDTLGHAAGDELLRQIAQRLRGALRAGDEVRQSPSFQHTAGRIGGDEFVVVLEGIPGRDEATTVARRLLEVLAEPYDLGGQLVQSTASIGIVTSEQAANDANTVMRDADTAMYEAKRTGRGRWVVFDPSMHECVARGLVLEQELRRALGRGDLFVVYQPVLPLHPGAVLSMEALVRWRHPVRGLVSPVEFIPVAEDSGLIVALGRFVLDVACRQFVVWQSLLGPLAPQGLSVNLSARQLQAPGLFDEVAQCLRDTGMPARMLQLEVTETLAAQDDNARARLRELKALGLRIALDDFGTGYSSLACLHQLPVDTVKIDRSFVMHAEESAYHRVLIEATIRVAQTLGMGTVAEGIETPGQAALLAELHCDQGQGYHFSKPMPAEAVADWLQARAGVVPASGAAPKPTATPTPKPASPPALAA